MQIFSIATPFDALALVLRIGAVGTGISSLELLLNRRELGPTGLLDAEVQLTRSGWMVRTRRAPARTVLALLRSPQGTQAMLWMRLAAAVALVVGASVFEVARFGALIVAAVTILLRIRSSLGIHASGSMVMVTFTGAGLGLLVGTDRSMRFALLFIALQACLSYFVAGSSKLGTPSWRQGRAVPLIASTTMWGGAREAAFLEAHPFPGFAISWMTMLGESVVPLALVLPLPVGIAILCCAGLFHLSAAFVMRLNSFVWAFCSTYPAIIFCSDWLHHVHP
jgi:hypothetical protein